MSFLYSLHSSARASVPINLALEMPDHDKDKAHAFAQVAIDTTKKLLAEMLAKLESLTECVEEMDQAHSPLQCHPPQLQG